MNNSSDDLFLTRVQLLPMLWAVFFIAFFNSPCALSALPLYSAPHNHTTIPSRNHLLFLCQEIALGPYRLYENLLLKKPLPQSITTINQPSLVKSTNKPPESKPQTTVQKNVQEIPRTRNNSSAVHLHPMLQQHKQFFQLTPSTAQEMLISPYQLYQSKKSLPQTSSPAANNKPLKNSFTLLAEKKQNISSPDELEKRCMQEIALAMQQYDAPQREKRLLHFITSIAPDLPDHPSLWKEVMQARYLYCKTMEPVLEEFQTHQYPAYAALERQIHQEFNAYIALSQKAADSLPSQNPSLEATEKQLLSQLVHDLQAFKYDTYVLSNATDDYAQRIVAYLQDAAKVPDPRYSIHPETLLHLTKKLDLLNHLNSKLFSAPTSMFESTIQLENFAVDALSQDKASLQTTSANNHFQQKFTTLLNQMPTCTEINQALTSILSLDISP